MEGHAAFFCASPKLKTEKGGGRGRHAVGAAGEGQPVVQYQANDLPEAEGDDGQIVTVHAQYREAEQGTCGGGHDCRQRQHAPEAQAEILVSQRQAVRTNRIERDIPQIQQAGQAHDDVQPQTEKHVDQPENGDG